MVVSFYSTKGDLDFGENGGGLKISELAQMQTTAGKTSFRTAVVYKPSQCKRQFFFLKNNSNNKTPPKGNWGRTGNIVFSLM